MMTKQTGGFGFPDEQQSFLERHKLFFERFDNLRKAQESSFIRRLKVDHLVDKAIFYLGRLCVDDFFEIMLLSANGYGAGALKILRGMYEKAVIARYLQQHPDSTEDFFDYYWVTAHKLGQAITRTFGANALPPDKPEEVEKEFKRVRHKFMITDCKKCKTQKLNYTWSNVDFVSMASTVESLRKFIVPAYYLPNLRLHGSLHSIVNKLDITPTSITFKHGPEREDAENAFMTSHAIVLNAIDLQREHFHLLFLEPQMEMCVKDFMDIWEDGKKV
jgi:hypothetical protein